MKKSTALLLVLLGATVLFAAGGATVEQVHDPSMLLTDGTLPPRRLAVMSGDGTLELASATSENVIGVVDAEERPITRGFGGGGYFQFEWGLHVSLLPAARQPLVDVAAGDSLVAGQVCYQSNDGKVASTGTVRFGVAITAGDDDEPVRVVVR